jgi:hypothetical protein
MHIALVRSSGRTTIRVDGAQIFDTFVQGGLPQGDAGLIARNSQARFDDIDVRSIGRQDPYREDFGDGAANSWTPLSGTWSAASKVYASTAVIATAITQSPLGRFWEVARARADLAYTFKVRMLNPYGASGNLVGIAWVRDAANYTEAVFSPTGQARLNKVVNGRDCHRCAGFRDQRNEGNTPDACVGTGGLPAVAVRSLDLVGVLPKRIDVQVACAPHHPIRRREYPS